MLRRITLTFGLAFLFSLTANALPPGVGPLTFEDEFDGSVLDTTKWFYRASGPRLEAVMTPSAVSVSNGMLTIKTYSDLLTNYSGMISTAALFEQTYGYFEARIRFRTTSGQWGAFWIQSPTIGNPVGDPETAGVEMDIVEYRVLDPFDGVFDPNEDVSNRAHQALIWDGYTAGVSKVKQNWTAPLPGLATNTWHTWGLSWGTNGYVFYYDDIPVWTETSPISKRSEYMILSSEVWSTFAGPIPAGGYGSQETSMTGFDVDYVRVYQNPVPVPPKIILQPQSQIVPPGSAVNFSVSATGTAPDYQWRFNGTNILGATNTTFAISNAQPSDAGDYSVVVSNPTSAETSVDAALTVTGSRPPIIRLSNIWNIQAGSRTNVNSANTERGLAINRFTGHALLVSRSTNISGALGIFTLNAQTGAPVGKLDINAINNNAAFRLNKVGVAADGVIYAANLTTSTNAPFVIYRWANESAAPTIAYSGLPDGTATARWGDSFAVAGSGSATRLITSSTAATNVIVFTTTDGTNFSANKINPTPTAGAGEFSKGLWLGDSGTFYNKNRNAVSMLRYTYNPAANSAAILTNVAGLDTSMIAITVEPGGQLLFGLLDSNTTNTADHSLKAYDISNPSAPVVISNFNFLALANGTSSNNSTFSGAVDSDGTRIVALDTQNGIVALRKKLLIPPSILTQPLSQTKNPGESVTFTATADGDVPRSYQWQKNGAALSDGGNISGATSLVLTLTDISPADLAVYTLVVTNVAGAETSLGAVLTFPAPPPGQFSGATVLPDGRFRTTLNGSTNFYYAIETSTNLVDWVTLTNIFNETGSIEFIDEAAPNHPYRFYRAR